VAVEHCGGVVAGFTIVVELAETDGDQQVSDDLLDAAVITTGTEAYRRTDGIAVIPLCLLGP